MNYIFERNNIFDDEFQTLAFDTFEMIHCDIEKKAIFSCNVQDILNGELVLMRKLFFKILSKTLNLWFIKIRRTFRLILFHHRDNDKLPRFIITEPNLNDEKDDLL